MKIDIISVSFVMPCLNEAETIGRCVARAREAAEIVFERYGLRSEVLVADNGSTDGSQAIAVAGGARVVAIGERGYGAALRGGFAAAIGRFLVMADSDCSYDFVEAVPMIGKLIDGAELCMGSRFKGEIKPGAMPWKNRYVGNPVLSGILRLLFHAPVSDAHCGLRALRRDAFERLNLSSTGMEFASEMVLKAALLGLRIEEVPVTLSPDGRSRAPHLKPWRDGFRHLFYMLMLCPAWLFFAPAALLAAFGLGTLALLLAGEGEAMVPLGPFVFGDHWAVPASGALILAVQTASFGLIALLKSYRDGIRRPQGIGGWLLERSQLHHWLLAGLALVGLGLAWSGMITAGWVSSGFASLDAMRSLIAAVTAVVIGIQLFFAGFLLSIVAGNTLRHSPV